ncbi:class IV adenylate cyclase [Patescibacteria group bacterium]|nr:class IV adenylate cyclase [Patescibacteria group bacterium]
MANNNIEIEIQVNIENPDALLLFLKDNAVFRGEKRQIDEYFTPPHRDFIEARPAKEWLRLRDADGNCSINYKNWYFDEAGKSDYCDEYETVVESSEQMRKIFSALNFKSLVVVEKVRKTWTYNDFAITMDSVKNLGDFAEIEYIGKDDKVDPIKTTDEMVELLKKIGCGKIKRNYVGYPFLLLFPQEVKYDIL